MDNIFADADKAIDAKYGDQSSAAPDTGQAALEVTDKADQATPAIENKGAEASQAQAILDLSKYEKVMLDGKEITLKQLMSERMMQSDYTKKMQEMAKDRDFRDNLDADLAKLERDPSLLSEFKKIYPAHFHRAGEYAVRGIRTQEKESRQDTNPSEMVKQFVEEAVGPIRSELDQYKTEAAVKQLDGIFQEMKTKYPDAKEKYALAELQTLKDMGVPIDHAKIDEVFKGLHDETKKLKESYHLEQINKQKQANAKAKDVPSGGGIPGQAPKAHKLRTEADWNNLEKDLTNHLRTSQQLS